MKHLEKMDVQVSDTKELQDLGKAKNFVSVKYFWFIPCPNPKSIAH